MKTHDLKILPEFFEPVASGEKRFELRKDDRGYRAGDRLILREWTGERYTGRSVLVEVTYLVSGSWLLQPNVVAMSIHRLDAAKGGGDGE